MNMRKGFTLVELLIVIIIIGVLAAAMLLSSGTASDSAKASNVVSNMRSLKTACVLFYKDNMDVCEEAAKTNTLPSDPNLAGGIDPLKKYMDNPRISANYKIVTGTVKEGASTTYNRWFVKFDLNSEGYDAGVKDKLKGQAKSVGLYKTATEVGEDTTLYDGGNEVYMIAR